MTYYQSPGFRTSMAAPDTKRKLFISYHHAGDGAYYQALAALYGKQGYDFIQDNSLRDARDSDDPEYVMRAIRENHIAGTSCTIVLCGEVTYKRKYVDWEIRGTLDMHHGLIGVYLPTIYRDPLSRLLIVPDRLNDNIQSGYAVWMSWETAMSGPRTLLTHIEDAILRPKPKIVNTRPMMKRNTPG